VGFLIAAAGYLLNFFAGSNIVLLLIAAILTGGGTVPASMLAALIVIECADYNEWNHHPRMEGTMSSINGLAGKIGAAVGTGILGVLLTASGFTGDAATTPQSSLVMIRMLFSLIPMALYILTSLTLRQYKLTEQLPQIREDIKERRAARNTAKTGAD
jgi:Na+/melibiose symporter-like transporter